LANTTWNPLDKSANVTLSNLNLTATAISGGSNRGCRSVNSQSSGKYYFEVTMNWAASNDCIGLATSSALFTATTINTCVLPLSGAVVLNNALYSPTVNFGSRAAGNVIGIAVDFNSALMWFRVAPSGNWNANATFAPGGTGGINISSLVTGGVALYAYAFFISFTYAYTANFGDTAFSGAVPSGFTGGFPAGSTTLNAPIVTMIG
jgi:hypothetical protein